MAMAMVNDINSMMILVIFVQKEHETTLERGS